MSGGSGCQQIKLFVFRPGFGTLSLLFSFLPLSPGTSFFSALFLFSQYIFFLKYTIIQSPALPLLDWISLSFPLPPAPPFFPHFLRACARHCLMRLVFADEAHACVYICAPHSMMTLVFADEASESASVCVLLFVCVCCAWCSMMRPVFADEASVSSLCRPFLITRGKTNALLWREGDRRKGGSLKEAEECIKIKSTLSHLTFENTIYMRKWHASVLAFTGCFC